MTKQPSFLYNNPDVLRHVVHDAGARTLQCGVTLPEVSLAYQTYGTLNADASNADVVCCQSVPELGVGVALMDRLRRASQT